jgi:hypothetical protein
VGGWFGWAFPRWLKPDTEAWLHVRAEARTLQWAWSWLHQCGPTSAEHPSVAEAHSFIGHFCGTTEVVPFQGAHCPGLKPTLVGMALAGVETPASLRVRLCAGDEPPAYLKTRGGV